VTASSALRKVDIELSRELGLPPWCPSVYEVGIGIDEYDDGISTDVPPSHRPHWERVRDLRRSLVAGCDRFQCAAGRNIARTCDGTPKIAGTNPKPLQMW
jgi:hypothetical protein